MGPCFQERKIIKEGKTKSFNVGVERYWTLRLIAVAVQLLQVCSCIPVLAINVFVYLPTLVAVGHVTCVPSLGSRCTDFLIMADMKFQ